MGEEITEGEKILQRGFICGAGKLVWRGLLQGLTPAHCLVCAAAVQEAASVCVLCWQKLRIVEEPVCDVMVSIIFKLTDASKVSMSTAIFMK